MAPAPIGYCCLLLAFLLVKFFISDGLVVLELLFWHCRECEGIGLDLRSELLKDLVRRIEGKKRSERTEVNCKQLVVHFLNLL